VLPIFLLCFIVSSIPRCNFPSLQHWSLECDMIDASDFLPSSALVHISLLSLFVLFLMLVML
jgi:hypothetical protein